ncbi:MAG: AbrB/MazE/SpoVT family DNA-binding domain-containing protein [Bacillota bacterium]
MISKIFILEGIYITVKATGIVRKVDDLGRVVIPKELRNTMDIERKDPMEVYVEGDKIILTKYKPSCIFCNNQEDIVEFEETTVCKNCIKKLSD